MPVNASKRIKTAIQDRLFSIKRSSLISLASIVYYAFDLMSCPLSVSLRTGVFEKFPAGVFIPLEVTREFCWNREIRYKGRIR
jgi:hypothetical protein